jgi:acetate kinase
MEVLPNVPQIAIFDTAFHQTIPQQAFTYPVPSEWLSGFGVRKYGFHGSSHLYVTKRAAKWLGKPRDQVNLITLHIGNGVSFSAIRNGVCVDTSMGMTPLEGAMMGTRSGDIDPAIVGFMSEKLSVSASDIVNILNKKSGHFGVTQGRFVDRRDIEKASNDGDVQAKLSLEMEIYRIKKYIGAYMAVLGNVDALVFTAGVGENNSTIRQGALSGLERLGIVVDVEKNKTVRSSSGETCISLPESPVQVLVLPTNEEAVLVEDVVAILEDRYDEHTRYVYQFEK